MVKCKMKAQIKNNKLIIEVPLTLLKYSIDNNLELPAKVTDINGMGAYFAKYILIDSFDSESGLSGFERLLDYVADNAFGSCEGWLKEDDDLGGI